MGTPLSPVKCLPREDNFSSAVSTKLQILSSRICGRDSRSDPRNIAAASGAEIGLNVNSAEMVGVMLPRLSELNIVVLFI